MRPDIPVRHITRFICLALLLLLAACASLRKDGPPRRSIDVSRIQDAVPKVEPRSRSGNSTYKVYGKTYHVKSSSHHYIERGVASWYGSKFDAQPTSSGEIYNMLGMTAAHKTLPLPTYVQVTNLANHKSVIVKVNDRGPFAGDRIIDLSYVAAKKIGMTGRGTAYVEVRAINPEESTVASRQSAASRGLTFPSGFRSRPASFEHFFIQVGTFENRHFAERLKTRLGQVVQSPVRITSTQPGKKRLYRVEIGPLLSPVTVSAIRNRLKTAGITQSNVTRRRAEA